MAVMEKNIEFESGGLTLRGVLHTLEYTPAICVVISHGFAGHGDSPKWRFTAAGLARGGFPALRFSHAGCRGSDGDFADTTLTGRVRDLRAAMGAVTDLLGVRAIGLVGSSFGGVTALLCADDPLVRCAVIAGTPSDFDFFAQIFPQTGTDAEMLQVEGLAVKRGLLDDVAQYDVLASAASAPPLCVLHGENDELLQVRHAREIHDRAQSPKALHILSGADHPFSDPQHQQVMLTHALAWFRKYLY
jgi:uncharacterized protein